MLVGAGFSWSPWCGCCSRTNQAGTHGSRGTTGAEAGTRQGARLRMSMRWTRGTAATTACRCRSTAQTPSDKRSFGRRRRQPKRTPWWGTAALSRCTSCSTSENRPCIPRPCCSRCCRGSRSESTRRYTGRILRRSPRRRHARRPSGWMVHRLGVAGDVCGDAGRATRLETIRTRWDRRIGRARAATPQRLAHAVAAVTITDASVGSLHHGLQRPGSGIGSRR